MSISKLFENLELNFVRFQKRLSNLFWLEFNLKLYKPSCGELYLTLNLVAVISCHEMRSSASPISVKFITENANK